MNFLFHLRKPIEETCPRCGCEMYARCEPANEGGCFFDVATEEELDLVIKEGLSHPKWKPTTAVMRVLMKQNKTRNDKIFLALAIEDITTASDDSDSDSDSDSEDEEMPSLIPINAK